MLELPFLTDINFTNIKEISPKDIKIRKKLNIYVADNLNKKQTCILYINQKSRVLQKEVTIYEDIIIKTKNFGDYDFKEKYIFIDAPLCSKAKLKLENHDWIVISLYIT